MNSLDGVYTDNTFDNYDYILCVGSYHLDSFQECARRHPVLLGKTLVPAGYPKLDFMLASYSTKRQPRDPSVSSTVVYAPTHITPMNEGLVSLSHYGEAIINALLSEGHRVIFRPHHDSFGDRDRPVVNRICHLHADNPNFSLDTSTDYTASYSLADLMVTDLSGTGFTFSFSFGRPCIFFSPSEQAERGLDGIQFDARHRIGASVRDIDKMIQKVSELCDRDMADEIDQFRNETVFNVGKSAPYIVDCLEDILAGRERPEWVRL
jgi:CDP-glycerol glycerophosphotransferase (TagB/SpsB family)